MPATFAAPSSSCARRRSRAAAESTGSHAFGWIVARHIGDHRTMKAWMWATVALAVACGSGKDESAAFVGTWPGAISDVGFADGIARTAVITRSGDNELTISGLCDAPFSASV